MTATADGDGDGAPVVVVLVGALVALSLLVGGLALVGESGDEVAAVPPAVAVASVADEWLRAWAGDDRAALERLVVAPEPTMGEHVEAFRRSLRPGRMRVRPGVPEVAGHAATVPFDAAIVLPGLGTWRYAGQLALRYGPVGDVRRLDLGDDPEGDRGWRVLWSPAVLHPDLTTGRRVGRTRTWGPRAPVLAADGSPLVGSPIVAGLAGSLGPAGPDQATLLGPAYQAGDVVGTSGLQASQQRRLAGRPGGEVQLLDGDQVVGVLAAFGGAPGQPVRATIDPRLQAVAEATLADVDQPAAMVVIQPSTGAVRAVASRPLQGFNRALLGRYPPGSTFKVVTTAALLSAGVVPEQTVSCPPEARVGGRRFVNAEGESLGEVPFRRAFAKSCNTAFVQLSSALEPGLLVAAAERFGFNASADLGVAVNDSSFPVPGGPADQAASAIGQGRVVATPLQMAAVAAAVAGGGYRPPRLVDEGAVAAPRPVGVAGTESTLQELMRLVVSEGTATAARLPGEPVGGKTGTAEFGTERPPRTHAWFIGFRGDLAIAVIVEDTGFGGVVAAPLGARFFRAAG